MKRILIVDDNEDNLYLLRMLLEGHGYDVAQARNGSEALDVVRAKTPVMIISDILMPEMDGFTFCGLLKKDEALKQVPFIFYTATYTDPRDERLALDLGADAFIIKPTEPEDFMSRIETVLAAKKNGGFTPTREQTAEEVVVLKEYNEVLIRKLEHKMLELEKANMALEGAIQEKDALLREIHHRVRNNMQIIKSMISLQLNERINSMTHDEIISAGLELQNRIQTMALVHDLLYTSKNLSKINMNEYMHSLMESLLSSYHLNNELIRYSIQITDGPMSIIMAIPIGQIVNELVTNAIKYAFPGGGGGEIKITMTTDDTRGFVLTVRDNGAGLPGNVTINSNNTMDTFGLHLVSLLVNQLNGSIDCSNEKGAVFVIRFRENNDDNLLPLPGR